MNVHGLNDLRRREEEEEKKKMDLLTGGNKNALGVRAPGRKPQIRGTEGPVGPGEKRFKVTMWANGFQVDDGQFRDSETPVNAVFKLEVLSNRVPQELVQKANGKRATMSVEDRSGEVYEETSSAKAFVGVGQRTGRGVAAVPAGTVNLEVPGPYVNPAYPRATVKVRFHNGEAREVEVNETTRVEDIRDFVMRAAPVTGNFTLEAGFPPKPVTNLKLTVQEAELANSSVIQKLL